MRSRQHTGIFQHLEAELEKNEIGRGTFGVVYEAEYQGRSCVVKVISKRMFRGYHDMKMKFRREIDLLRNFNHKNIVKLLSVEENDLEYKLYFQKCDLNLKQFIKSKYNDFKTSIKVAFQIINGICYLHLQRVAHRDLKDTNIMLKMNQGQYQVKIIDFGQSRQIIKGQITNYRLGTLEYMAPEVRCHRNQGYNEKCDLWAMGILLYQLLYDQNHNKKQSELVWPLPAEFKIQDQKKYTDFITECQEDEIFFLIFPKQSRVPPFFSRAIAKMLKINPQQRASLIELIPEILTNIQQLLDYDYTHQQIDQVRLQLSLNMFNLKILEQKKIKEQKLIADFKLRFNMLGHFLMHDKLLKPSNKDYILDTCIFIARNWIKLIDEKNQLLQIYQWKDADFQGIQISHQKFWREKDKVDRIANSFLIKGIILHKKKLSRYSVLNFVNLHMNNIKIQILKTIDELNDY